MYRPLMFNEEKLSFEIYTNGFTKSSFDFWEAVLVAKYFRHILGYGDARTKTFTENFCKKYDRFFNEIINSGQIKNIVKKSKKEYMNKSNDIHIYQSEIDSINNIIGYKKRRILFGFLIISKINGTGYIGNKQWNSVRKSLHSKISNREIGLLTKEYSDLKLIEAVKSSHKILFISEDGDIVKNVTTKTIYNLNKVFEELFGLDLFVCMDCQNSFPRKSYNQKRCSSCKEKHIHEKRWIRANKTKVK